jgi:hypothetical protein
MWSSAINKRPVLCLNKIDGSHLYNLFLFFNGHMESPMNAHDNLVRHTGAIDFLYQTNRKPYLSLHTKSNFQVYRIKNQ